MLELLCTAYISCGGLFSDKVSLLSNCTWGEGVLCPCYNEFWGGGTCGEFS